MSRDLMLTVSVQIILRHAFKILSQTKQSATQRTSMRRAAQSPILRQSKRLPLATTLTKGTMSKISMQLQASYTLRISPNYLLHRLEQKKIPAWFHKSNPFHLDNNFMKLRFKTVAVPSKRIQILCMTLGSLPLDCFLIFTTFRRIMESWIYSRREETLESKWMQKLKKMILSAVGIDPPLDGVYSAKAMVTVDSLPMIQLKNPQPHLLKSLKSGKQASLTVFSSAFFQQLVLALGVFGGMKMQNQPLFYNF